MPLFPFRSNTGADLDESSQKTRLPLKVFLFFFLLTWARPIGNSWQLVYTKAVSSFSQNDLPERRLYMDVRWSVWILTSMPYERYV